MYIDRHYLLLCLCVCIKYYGSVGVWNDRMYGSSSLPVPWVNLGHLGAASYPLVSENEGGGNASHQLDFLSLAFWSRMGVLLGYSIPSPNACRHMLQIISQPCPLRKQPVGATPTSCIIVGPVMELSSATFYFCSMSSFLGAVLLKCIIVPALIWRPTSEDAGWVKAVWSHIGLGLPDRELMIFILMFRLWI